MFLLICRLFFFWSRRRLTGLKFTELRYCRHHLHTCTALRRNLHCIGAVDVSLQRCSDQPAGAGGTTKAIRICFGYRRFFWNYMKTHSVPVSLKFFISFCFDDSTKTASPKLICLHRLTEVNTLESRMPWNCCGTAFRTQPIVCCNHGMTSGRQLQHSPTVSFLEFSIYRIRVPFPHEWCRLDGTRTCLKEGSNQVCTSNSKCTGAQCKVK